MILMHICQLNLDMFRFVQNAFSALSNSFDSLFDREDKRNELGGSPASQEHGADKAIQRSIEKMRKNIKAEMKGMLKELQDTLREMEEQNKNQMNSISATQQLMIQAMQQNEEEVIENGEENQLEEGEEGESESDLSASSLSLGDMARLSTNKW